VTPQVDDSASTQSAATGVRLLDQVVSNTLLSDYPSAPAQVRESRPWRLFFSREYASHLWRAMPVVVIVAAILTYSAIAKSHGSLNDSRTKVELANRVDAARSATDALIATNAATAEGNRQLAAELIAQTQDGDSLTRALDRYTGRADASAVTGKGVCFLMNDHRIRWKDTQFQQMVNMVWRSRPAAVAIYSVRLSTRSAIRGAGSSLLVGYAPIARPVRMCAVYPDASGMQRSNRLWPKIRSFASAGDASVTRTIGTVTIPAAAERMLTVRYAVSG
jgi:uncharacterized protein YlxW (UPF0749 family)